MRTISEIKESICAAFMNNEDVARLYSLPAGSDFSSCFSKVSIVNLLFYIFACAAWTLEQLFAAHREEVDARIEEILPHRPKWYRDRVLAFMKDRALVTETDRYDTSVMSDAEIEAARVVKHAVAVENPDASLLTVKVAGEKDGVRCKLDETTEAQLGAYLSEIKDAGVRIGLVNIDPDTFNCQVDIYYDPMLLPTDVEQACREVVKRYVENLPFNGEYTNMALVDALQVVPGVRIVEFKTATTSVAGESTLTAIDAKYTPAAGYFKVGVVTLIMKANG